LTVPPIQGGSVNSWRECKKLGDSPGSLFAPSCCRDLSHTPDRVDEEVVVDDNLVTSRNPHDIPAFNREMIELFGRAGSTHRRSAESA
jgi:hypothetical protein